MAFSFLWSLGLIISVILFSVVFGFIFYYNESSKKTVCKYVIVSVILTSILVYVIDLFKNQLFSAIGAYNYALLFLIAFILIFIGYLLAKENNFKNAFNKVISLSYLCFILILAVCILSKSDLFGYNSLQLSLFTAILFNLLIIVIFYLLKRLNLFRNSFNLLRDLFFIVGVYFLIVSLFLPNIISLDMGDMKPINIVSIESIVFTIVFIIVVAVLGLWYYRKNSLLK